jgi:hypothetical protein
MVQRQAGPLGHLDHGHAAKDIPRIATVIAFIPPAADQSASLIEMERRNRHATAFGDLANR